MKVDGTITLEDDLDEIRPFATIVGGHDMGADRAEEFGRRSGVSGELLVRLHPTKVTAAFDIADRPPHQPRPVVRHCYVDTVADGVVTGFHHLALTVRDLDASAEWYEGLFDLDPVVDEAGDERRAKVYRLRDTDVMLGLTQHRSNDQSTFRPDRTGLDHAAFAVATRADVDAWVDRLDAAGVAHSGRVDIPLGAILNFPDPDGIQLSIFYEGD